jgi:serine O-acetyltransferase
MIKNRQDLQRYLDQDLAQADYRSGLKSFLFNKIWRYLRLLRHYEYAVNCRRGIYGALVRGVLEYRLKNLGALLGFSLPPNVFGPGLALPHIGTIVVNPAARIGANCRLHICVNIGAARDSKEAPQLGDNCYIGPGAKLFGPITLGNDISVGANAVVNKSFAGDGRTLVGVPAKVLAKDTIKKEPALVHSH